ncbi:MAG: enoyl-CoA hydratase/isomerase family protein [Dehalococcoidales bacterium]|nr:enoyl-CoA hydratase/isomerase family protein [Dehalococcoidales bacterium]
MEFTDILYRKEGHVAIITLNKPEKMNSFSAVMQSDISQAISDSEQDKDIRVIILTATGRAFCAGADVKAMASRFDQPAAQARENSRLPMRNSLYLQFQQCPKPIICAVNGVAAGGGLDMALACDIRIASDKARFAEVFVRRGMIPASGGTYFLPRIVGIDRALLMVWTGDMVDATEAERIGLVTMVVPHEELEMATMDLAEKLAKGPPLAIQAAKRAIYEGLEMNLEATFKYLTPIVNKLNQTEDHKEGARAFVEKREPVFKGE